MRTPRTTEVKLLANEIRNLFGTHVVLADDKTLQTMYATYAAGTAAMADVEGFSVSQIVSVKSAPPPFTVCSYLLVHSQCFQNRQN